MSFPISGRKQAKAEKSSILGSGWIDRRLDLLSCHLGKLRRIRSEQCSKTYMVAEVSEAGGVGGSLKELGGRLRGPKTLLA